jgi:hypothetical protein
MSDLKTGLFYSELSNRVYWATVNQKTGIARSGKKDVTSDFIGVMLQKFPVGFCQFVSCNGVNEAMVIVAKPEQSHNLVQADKMYNNLKRLVSYLEEIAETPEEQQMLYEANACLAAARGEK